MAGIGIYLEVNVFYHTCYVVLLGIHTIFYSSQHSLAMTGNTTTFTSAGSDAALIWAFVVFVVIKVQVVSIKL